MREHVDGLLRAATRRRAPAVPLFLALCALLMCLSLPLSPPLAPAPPWISAPSHAKGGVPTVHGGPAARRHARGTCVHGRAGPRRCRARLIATGAERH
ncbi:hypothetical protein AB0M57_12400 [Streptomyces sp. NPDC051597]|uniref:hypothetical protein n=1 Tax=Streptomyces sp. NPDC051597 TaxID=3155049 RepID=UPI00344590E5